MTAPRRFSPCHGSVTIPNKIASDPKNTGFSVTGRRREGSGSGMLSKVVESVPVSLERTPAPPSDEGGSDATYRTNHSRAAPIISWGILPRCGGVMIISIRPGSARYLVRASFAHRTSAHLRAVGRLLPSMISMSGTGGN